MQLIGVHGVMMMKSNKSKLIKISILLFVVIGIGWVIQYRDQLDAAALEQWVNNAGAAGPIVFMLLYAIGTVFFFPGSVLTLAGGAIFGPVLGTFYNLTGATLGATLAFIISRYLASDWVERKTGGRLKQLKEGVEGEGWRFVAFVRLVPLFPFNLLNYALGLTRIKLWHYILASYICMLPGAFAYTYLGYAGREAVAGGDGMIQKGLFALSILAIVAFIPSVISKMRRGPMLTVDDLKQLLDNNTDVLILDVRSNDEFAGELTHISQAVNIPVEQLLKRCNELTQYLEAKVVIVCRTDVRSVKAAKILTKNGFSDVHVIKGGMSEWHNKAYSTSI